MAIAGQNTPIWGCILSDLFFLDISKINSEDDLIDQIYQIIRPMGFSAALFSYTPVGWLPSKDPGVVKKVISIHLKEEILESWIQHHHLKPSTTPSPMSHFFDVFRKEMVNRVSPKMFDLREMLNSGYQNQTPKGDRWLGKILKAGVEQLFSIPHFSVSSEYWSLGLFRYIEDSNSDAPTKKQIAILNQLVSDLAEFSINELGWRDVAKPTLKRPLTKRELDCLYWASRGCTAEESSRNLGLKSETVRKYLKNASYKLGVKNKVAAVSTAHQLGLLGYTLGESRSH